MIELLKAIILDSQEMELETGVPRRTAFTPVRGKANVCIGVRRSGKSTFLFQIMQRLHEEGVPRQNAVYLNFFDDRLHGLQQGGLGQVLDAYYSLYPKKKDAERVYYFFDEMQTANGWESFVDRLLRTEKCEIYITGSSAHLLSREIATQLRGRALSWELFPFSFREYLDFSKVESTGALSTKKRLLVQNSFDRFWEQGGFPEVAGLEGRLRIKIHQEYLQAVLFRDLVERHDASHPRAVVDLAHWLMNNIASMYSINKLTGYLKSLGHNIPKSAVSAILGWFEDAYFLFTVRIFDASLARANSNPKKVYCIDHSLVTSVSSGLLVNSGHLLENLVFTALRRLYPSIHYYKTASGREVDFVAVRRGKSHLLVQVCESMGNPATRKREISALEEAMQEQHLPSGLIVTRREEERVEVRHGTITVLPAWQFLLELQEHPDE